MILDNNVRIVPYKKDEYKKGMTMPSYHIYLPPFPSTHEQLVPIDTSRKLNLYKNINFYDKHHKNFYVQYFDNNDHYRINTQISDYPNLSDDNRTLLILLNNRPEDYLRISSQKNIANHIHTKCIILSESNDKKNYHH